MFAAPILWASTACIADDLSNVTENVSTLQSEVVIPMKETVASLMENEADLTSKTDKVVRAVKLLLAQVQSITETVDEIKTDLVYHGQLCGSKIRESSLRFDRVC
jgi:cytochrome c556